LGRIKTKHHRETVRFSFITLGDWGIKREGTAGKDKVGRRTVGKRTAGGHGC